MITIRKVRKLARDGSGTLAVLESELLESVEDVLRDIDRS